MQVGVETRGQPQTPFFKCNLLCFVRQDVSLTCYSLAAKGLVSACHLDCYMGSGDQIQLLLIAWKALNDWTIISPALSCVLILLYKAPSAFPSPCTVECIRTASVRKTQILFPPFLPTSFSLQYLHHQNLSLSMRTLDSKAGGLWWPTSHGTVFPNV